MVGGVWILFKGPWGVNCMFSWAFSSFPTSVWKGERSSISFTWEHCLRSIPQSGILSPRRQWQPTPVSLPGKSHGQRCLVGCSPWGRKESGTNEQLTLTYLPVFLPGEFHEQRSLVGYSPWGHKESYTTERLTATHRSNFTSPMLCTQELTKEIISSPNLNI